MEKFNYIIVDDEYPSHVSVQQKLKSFSNYHCQATFFNPQKALEYLQSHSVDLIFLDVQMKEMTGFQFIEKLCCNVFLVILTAYTEKYSLQAHDYFIDPKLLFFANKAQFKYYLPKIISRFEQVYEDYVMLNRFKQLSKNEIHTFPRKIDNKSILLDHIVFMEIIGHNLILIMKDKVEHVFRMSLCELISFLPNNFFLRIKRNIVINLMYVTAFTGNTVSVAGQHFLISLSRRKEAIPKIQKFLSQMENNN